jgi:hypothetical protein
MSIATTRPSEVVGLSQSSSKHERNHSQRKKESVTFCLLYKGEKNPVCGNLGAYSFLSSGEDSISSFLSIAGSGVFLLGVLLGSTRVASFEASSSSSGPSSLEEPEENEELGVLGRGVEAPPEAAASGRRAGDGDRHPWFVAEGDGEEVRTGDTEPVGEREWNCVFICKEGEEEENRIWKSAMSPSCCCC